MSPSTTDGKHEVHITADVALAFQQYVFMALEHDTYFLLLERGLEVIDEIAKYWVSRSTYNSTSDQYEILGTFVNKVTLYWIVNIDEKLL